jgi:hypothetical protein
VEFFNVSVGLVLIVNQRCVKLRASYASTPEFNRLTPNDLQRSRAVRPLEIKIHSKNMRE